MKEFVLWIMQTVPSFLLEPPISAFTGILLLLFTGRLFSQLIHISR